MQENEFLKEKIYNEYNEVQFWLGMKVNSNDNGFEWVDGSDVRYKSGGPWATNQPSDVNN